MSKMSKTRSVFVPRLCFDSVEVLTKAVEYSVRALGYQRIKSEQLEVVMKFLEGYDVFVSLPTGGGKSLCLACLPTVFDRLRGVILTCLLLSLFLP